MKTAGIVCDLSYQRSLLIENYYRIVSNLFENTVIVNSSDDLSNIDILFIGNEHFGPHRNIWFNDRFISECHEQYNKRGMRTVVICGEKIFNTPYPICKPMQEAIWSIPGCIQYAFDVEDAITLNRPVFGYPMSKYYHQFFPTNTNRLDKCLFIGQYTSESYSERRVVLDNINQYIETDIHCDVPNSWKEYLETYSQYKYALCPISNANNGFPTRFYEALLVGCIPIMQVRKNTLDFYREEGTIEEAVFFTDVHELKDKLPSVHSVCHSNIVGEDRLRDMLKDDNIII